MLSMNNFVPNDTFMQTRKLQKKGSWLQVRGKLDYLKCVFSTIFLYINPLQAIKSSYSWEFW